MITFNNIVERFKVFADAHFFVKSFSFGSPDDVDLSKFTSFPLMHLVYTGATYDAGTKTYNLEVYILDVPADKTKKTDRQKEVVSDAEQCAEDIIADIKNGGNIFLFAQDYEVVNATTTPLEEETKNVLSGVLLDLSVAIPYEWDACNAPIDGVEPGGTEVTYARRGVLRMLTLDGSTDIPSVRTIKVTNGTLTDDGDGVVSLDTGGVDRLSQLEDTAIVTPADRESLIYDAGQWVNDTLGKGDVGLANVDNTSDANKPVSTATQTALDAKADTSAVPTELNDLSDVTITGTPTGNQALIFDGSAGVFKSLPNFSNRFETEAENNKQAILPFPERVYTVKADGDGIFIDAQSDTPTAGKVIKRKIYQKTGFLESGAVIGDFTLVHTFADDTAYSATESTFEGFRDGDTYGTPPFTLIQTWEEVDAAPSFTGLLNESYGSGAEAAYSTRRLNGLYSGDCMTIRRASDGTTQSIGFVGEEIDESAIETFCSGTTCTVATWFDQSGNGNNATQTTAANQPTIYTGGQLVKEGGRLALDFDGSNDYLSFNQIDLTGDCLIAHIATHNAADSAYGHGGNNFGAYQATTTQLRWRFNGATYYATVPTITAGDQYLSLFRRESGTANMSYDGVDTTSQALSGTGSFSLLGATNTTSHNLLGKAQEYIFYTSAKNSSDRTDIESNISAYFQSAKLLDEQYGEGAEAAYSTRQLRRDQTECMVIRRASDSTTTTIGFDSNGNIDEAAIETFCTGTTCTVQTWKDQSSNGNDATQSDSTKQPTIYTGGALVKENGKVALDFDGSNDQLDYVGLTETTLTSFHVAKPDQTNSGDAFLGWDGTTGSAFFRYNSNGTMRGNFNGGFNTTTNYSAAQNLVFAKFGTSLAIGYNGSTAETGSATGLTSTGVRIGQKGNVDYFNGKAQEIVVYASDKSSDRTSIESNIGDHFTQNTPLLDTYSGAAAAYSLRKLRTAYTGDAVEVYNGSSYADIGFNVFGELDTVALAAHCGSNDGFVSKWYDQAGSNDATQTTTANMPKIYDGTTGVLTENGKPALSFDGGDDFLTPLTSAASDYTLHAVTKNSSTQSYLMDSENGRLILEARGTNRGVYFDGAWRGTSHTGTSQQLQSIYAVAPSSGQSFVNGTQINTGVSYTQKAIGGTTRIGGYNGGGNRIIGSMQEFIIYASDQSANRTNIEDNINTFYNIY